MKRERWVWMPHSAHFICGQDCRFHLATYVGGYIVSTIGEYLPDVGVREILAERKGIKLEGKGDARRLDFMVKHGFVDIGYARKYETMVFKAHKDRTDDCGCPYRWSGGELELMPANDSKTAIKNHYRLCEKWSRKAA